MVISNKVKSLVEYYGKLLIILTCVMSVMGLINITVGEELISQFWQGFILASSCFIFDSVWKQNKELARIERVIEELEEIIQKYDTAEEIEKATKEKLDEYLNDRDS